MDANGSNQSRLTQGIMVREFSWSPDGKQIAFVNSSREIYTINPDGTDQQQLTENKVKGYDGWIGNLDWSPDNRQIVFQAMSDFDYEIFLLDIESGQQKQLTDNFHHWDRYPLWSPDGQHIAFTSDRNGPNEIFIMDKDGSNQHSITELQTNSEHRWSVTGRFDWSSDGNKIAFTAYFFDRQEEYTHYEIFTISPDGSDMHQITSGEQKKTNHSPSWSPDGNQIAFMMYIPGQGNQICIMRADGLDAHPILPEN
jgi:TolB protein